jgi:hypothetical protein
MPGMTAVARQIAADLTLRCNTQITKVSRNTSGWELTDSAGETHRQFDYVIVSLPAPQSGELLGDHPLAVEAKQFPMTPCWAILAGFEGRIEVDWDGAFVQGSPLAWVARNSSKPGREPSKECWVFHASADWSAAHFELDREDAAAALLSEFSKLVSMTLPKTNHLDAHRWRYSATSRTDDRLALFDGETGLAVCGDWLAGGRVEGAFRSGLAAAAHIIRAIGAVSEERIFGAM